jgi:pimeloyl-ACP methyl ester carboxylesterase
MIAWTTLSSLAVLQSRWTVTSGPDDVRVVCNDDVSVSPVLMVSSCLSVTSVLEKFPKGTCSFECRCFGGSTCRSRPTSFQEHIDTVLDVAEFLASRTNRSSVDLIGYSLSSLWVLNATTQRPHVVRRVVLVNPLIDRQRSMPVRDVETARYTGVPLGWLTYLPSTLQKSVYFSSRIASYDCQKPPLQTPCDLFPQLHGVGTVEMAREAFEHERLMFDVQSEFSKASVLSIAPLPANRTVHVLTGEYDNLCPRSLLTLLAEHMPQVTIDERVFYKSAHYVPYEEPERFRDVMREIALTA